MDFIANSRRYSGTVRRGSAIRNAGKVEVINVYAGNLIQVESVEGDVLRQIHALTERGNFSVQHIEPIISRYGAFPHLALVIHGFEMGGNDSEVVIVSTDYPIQEG